MLLSLNWLKKYVNLPKGLTAKKLAHDLTMSTVEVESVEDQAEKFTNIVIGKIVAIKAHPNADKLKIVIANIGKVNPVQIVCGGTNLKTNMLVPVALPGAKVRWHGESDLVELQETEIRGEKSFGMICSANEIGLENMFPCGEREIVDLSNLVQDRALNQHFKPGQNLATALGLNDVILELDNKSITHRPDLWNHYGVARELSVIYRTPLKDIFSASEKEIKKLRNKEIKGNELSIKIEDKKICPRYIGCVVKNITIAPSPKWLQECLTAVGVRPINNIVDITNYVMLSIGEPMHAFDNSKLKTANAKLNTIVVRKANKGEKIMTLDGVERILNEKNLVIANAEKPIALAGIMGGADSGVDNNTKEIVLEAANFDSINIRGTAQDLNLRTEAANRFEKKLPAEFAALGMSQALALIHELLPNAEIGALVDADYSSRKKIIINLSHEFLEKRIGQKLAIKEVKNILERLGFNVKCQMSNVKCLYKITVPFWRATGDIDCPEDIVEEIARIYGYDNLVMQKHTIAMDRAIYQKDQDLIVKIKNFLANNSAINEVFNYPWTEEKTLKKLGKSDKMIELANPSADSNRYLQTSLIPNLIKNVEDNLRHFDQFKIFELSRVYWPEFQAQHKKFKDLIPRQPKMLVGAVVALKDVSAFLLVKGMIENLFKYLRITDYGLQVTKPSQIYLDKEKFLDIMVNGHSLGWLGELKSEIYQQFDFKNKSVCFWEINFDELIAVETRFITSPQKTYTPLPQFPIVIRDLAFEMNYQIKWESIKDEILHFASLAQDDIAFEINFLSEFDLGGRKSVAFRIIYRAKRTLTDSEVEIVQNKIIKLMTEKFSGELRI